MKKLLAVYLFSIIIMLIAGLHYENLEMSNILHENKFLNLDSKNYMDIYYDFYDNNPYFLDKNTYYLNQINLKNNLDWKEEVMKARVYHDTFADQMFAF